MRLVLSVFAAAVFTTIVSASPQTFGGYDEPDPGASNQYSNDVLPENEFDEPSGGDQDLLGFSSPRVK